jgi:hypothetical protein
MDNPRCQAKTRLLLASQSAVEAYSRAVRELSRTIGNASRKEFHRLNVTAIRARMASIKARKDLNLHTEEHGC